MFKNAAEIRKAVDEGRKICWASENYVVKKDTTTGDYNIICLMNNNAIGLTWQDNQTLNGELWDFFDADNTPMYDRRKPDGEISERELMLLDEIDFLRTKLCEATGIPAWKDWNAPRSYIVNK